MNHTHDETCPTCYGERTALGLGPLPVITCYHPDSRLLTITNNNDEDDER